MRRGARTLFEGLSLRLEAGDVLGVVGANGSGKSTLLKLIEGAEAPDEGGVKLGGTVVLGHVSQSRGGLDPAHTVYEEISEGQDAIAVGEHTLNCRAYVSSFNLKGPAQEKKVAMLSGGERGRVHLAKALKSGCNLLLLDEPTNDLDVDTLRSLEEALADFEGSAVVVSHDRWFLDRVCTHLLLLHGDGRATTFAGTWGEYEAHVARPASASGADGAALAHLSNSVLDAARTAGRRGI
jgi:ATPase subunit of ABC transporter with duplicated ATPase domains